MEPDRMASRLLEFLTALRRRKVYRAGGVYVAVSLAIIGAADAGLPETLWAQLQVPVGILLLVGFPVALVLAWAYELRPESWGKPNVEEGVRTEDAPGRTEADPPVVGVGPQAGRSVAVLPFENMSPGSEEDYFADGIAEELTNALARQPGLRVAARTSAFAFRGVPIDVREIGARLNVSHIIEGSVRRSANTVRITAQLIDCSDGYHIWSEQFDRDLGDVFRIQEEIAARVVRGLPGEPSVEIKPEIPATELSAYEAFLRGRHALANFGPRSIARAIEEFQACIRIDDSYAPAFAGLADALTNQSIGFSDHPPMEAMTRAGEAARRALELDPELPGGHLSLALFRMWHEFDFPGAKEAFDRALEINPNFSDAYLWMEFYWTYVRHEFHEALRANRRAFHLSPLDSRANVRLGTIHMVFGQYDQAERSYHQALSENPDDPVSHLGLGDTLFRVGRTDEGISHVEKAVFLGGRPTPWLGMLASFLGTAGDEKRAREVFRELERRAESGYVSGFWMALALAGQQRFPEAFSRLDRAVEERDSNLIYLFAVPREIGLHDRPEFTGILNRIGLGHLARFI